MPEPPPLQSPPATWHGSRTPTSPVTGICGASTLDLLLSRASQAGLQMQSVADLMSVFDPSACLVLSGGGQCTNSRDMSSAAVDMTSAPAQQQQQCGHPQPATPVAPADAAGSSLLGAQSHWTPQEETDDESLP